jgi:hypothetical protein
VASIEKRVRDGVVRWYARFRCPEITYRVYAYLKPDDELAGRAAIARTTRQVVPHVYPVCTEMRSQ